MAELSEWPVRRLTYTALGIVLLSTNLLKEVWPHLRGGETSEMDEWERCFFWVAVVQVATPSTSNKQVTGGNTSPLASQPNSRIGPYLASNSCTLMGLTGRRDVAQSLNDWYPPNWPTGQNLEQVLWRAFLFDTTIHDGTPAPASYGSLFRNLVRDFALLTRLDLPDIFDSEASELPVKASITEVQLGVLLFSMVLLFCWRKALFPRTIWQ